MKKVLGIILAVLLFYSGSALAKEIKFEISLDRNQVALGNSLQLDLAFSQTQNIPALEIPAIDGFQSRYFGPSTRMSIVNGQMSSSITHSYSLLPLKSGSFKIGPFKFEYKGDSYTSNSLIVEVVEGQLPQASSPEPQALPELKDISDRVFLVIQPKKEQAYLNELIPLKIKLYVAKLAVRDIQFPEFSHEGFSVSENEQPKQYQEVLGGLNYDVIEFNNLIFGIWPGPLVLGPVKLKCNLIIKKDSPSRSPSGFDDFFGSDMFGDFFGKFEAHPLELKSREVLITIHSLPEENKPQGFSGAVGDFDLQVSAGPQEVKVGDPITLKMALTGEGNFNTVNAPKLSSEIGVKVYEPQVKQEKGSKSFEQIIMPQNISIKEVPEITFPFFNTRTGAYQTLTRGPFPIKVSVPEKEEVSKVLDSQPIKVQTVKEEKLGRDIIYIKAIPGNLSRKGSFLYKDKIFLIWQLVPFAGFICLLILYKRKKKLSTDISYARKLRAPKKAREGIRLAREYLLKEDSSGFYNAIFQTLQDYLGDRLHLPSQAITMSVIDDVLKDRQIPDQVLSKLREIFKDCDIYRYAATQTSRQDMESGLKKLEDLIDYFQRQKV